MITSIIRIICFINESNRKSQHLFRFLIDELDHVFGVTDFIFGLLNIHLLLVELIVFILFLLFFVFFSSCRVDLFASLSIFFFIFYFFLFFTLSLFINHFFFVIFLELCLIGLLLLNLYCIVLFELMFFFIHLLRLFYYQINI